MKFLLNTTTSIAILPLVCKYALMFLPLSLMIAFLLIEYFSYPKLAKKQCLIMDISFRVEILLLTILAVVLLKIQYAVDYSSDIYSNIIWIPCILFLLKKTMIKK